jgi:L-2-hydroxyglutarate oxidase LhgO
MMETGCVVIGAGVVGLAAARALAKAGHDCVIIDRGPVIGSETSSRNSEVIHAGLYYPTGSVKAEACVEGKAMLYAYLDAHGVPYRRLGKLVVATDDDELGRLEGIRIQAEINGVLDTSLISAREAQAMEPNLSCTGALVSPSTGIIDTHAYMLSLLGEAENHGAMLALNTVVERIIAGPGGFEVHTTGPDGAFALAARKLVNCAGLGAPKIAARTVGLDPRYGAELAMVKGNYFILSGPSPFARLIYPVPSGYWLGVHLTIDMGGQARFGPDTQPVEAIDYAVDSSNLAAFEVAIRRYWPGLPDGALEPGYAGIRPRVTRDAVGDFRIEGPETHGVEGLVNFFGIESPGLTSSLWFGERAVDLLKG